MQKVSKFLLPDKEKDLFLTDKESKLIEKFSDNLQINLFPEKKYLKSSYTLITKNLDPTEENFKFFVKYINILKEKNVESFVCRFLENRKSSGGQFSFLAPVYILISKNVQEGENEDGLHWDRQWRNRNNRYTNP